MSDTNEKRQQLAIERLDEALRKERARCRLLEDDSKFLQAILLEPVTVKAVADRWSTLAGEYALLHGDDPVAAAERSRSAVMGHRLRLVAR